jgi:threonine dehydrogenase-like Zn-dependent dehydrogenase
MRALVFDRSLRFEPRCPEPPADEGDCLLRVRLAGICSTDQEIVRGYLGFAGVLGHEFVAEVAEAPGPRRELVGRRVCAEINVVCGRCDLCLSGLSNHCRARTVVGILNHGGAFADFVRVPAANLHPVPDAVDDESAVFVEPLAAAFQILKQVNLSDGRRWVTVLGDGKLGLLVAQVLRNAGVPVRVVGRHPGKLALCEKWSIRSRPAVDVVPRHDQDVVVDCTGSAAGFETAMAMVRPRGVIVLKSTVAAGRALNLAPLVIDEVTVVGSRCGPFREALRALAAREVDVTSLIHRRMRIEQGVEAVEVAGRPGVLKVLLRFD